MAQRIKVGNATVNVSANFADGFDAEVLDLDSERSPGGKARDHQISLDGRKGVCSIFVRELGKKTARKAVVAVDKTLTLGDTAAVRALCGDEAERLMPLLEMAYVKAACLLLADAL